MDDQILVENPQDAVMRTMAAALAEDRAATPSFQLSAQDEADRAEAEARSALARKYFSRNLREEARAEAEAGIPKNRLLRALAGIGEGVNAYKAGDKYRSPQDRAYEQIVNEWSKQAPVMQRDLAATEGANARLETKRAELAQRQAEQNDRFALAAQGLMFKYQKQFAENPLLRQRAVESMARTRNLDAKTRLAKLEETILETTGAKPGSSATVTNALAALKNPDLKSEIERQKAFASELDVLESAAKSLFKAPSGKGGGSVSRTYKGVDEAGRPLSITQRTASGGGGAAPTAAQQSALAALQARSRGQDTSASPSLLPINPALPPAGAGRVLSGGVSRTTQALPPSAGIKEPSPNGATPFPELKAPPPKPESAAARQHNDLVTSIRDQSNLAMGLLSDPKYRSYFSNTMGPKQAWLGEVAGRIRENTARDTPERQAYKRLMSAVSATTLQTALQLSGKAVTEREQAMIGNMIAKLSDRKLSILDTPADVMGKMIQQRLMAEVLDHKRKVYTNSTGSEDERWAKARSQDFTQAIVDHTDRLMARWRAGQSIKPEDFNITKIAPALTGNPVAKWLEDFKAGR